MDHSLTSFDIAVLEKEFQLLKGAYLHKAFMLETGEIVLRFTMKREDINDRLLEVLPEGFPGEYSGTEIKVQDDAEKDLEEVSENDDVSSSDVENTCRDEGPKTITFGDEKETRGRYARINLFIDPAGIAFITDKNFDFPMMPHSFAMLLRKYLRNKRLLDVYQHQFDRVLVLIFGRGDETYSLVLELFKDGNLILVKDDTIIQPLFSRSYKARTLRARREYSFPPERYDPVGKTVSELVNVIDDSEQDIVRCLAMEVNLGGKLAEEVLRRIGLDKKSPASDLGEQMKIIISRTIIEIFDNTACGGPAFVHREKGIVRHISGFPIRSPVHKGDTEIEEYTSMNRALEAAAISSMDHLAESMFNSRNEKGEKMDPHVAKVERKLAQQGRGIQKFRENIRLNKELGNLIYLNYQRLEEILNALATAQEKMGWDEVRKRIKDIPDIVSVDPRTSGAVIKLLLENGDKKDVGINVKRNVNDNAAVYFERSKKAKLKMKGAEKALSASKRELDKARKTAEKNAMKADMNEKGTVIKRKEKTFWFESFRWFISSDGNIVVGGKDAKTNERAVKKHLDKDARYIHTDVHGSSSVVALPNEGEEVISDRTLKECGIFSACFSRAWQRGVGAESAYWVKPDQVSKSPQSGEFLPTGSFIIRGKRNWMPKLKMRIAVGKVMIEGVKKMMCGPVSALKTHSERYVIITPGIIEKNNLAKRIARVYEVSSETVMRLLPTGGGEIIDAYGLDMTLFKDKEKI